MKKISVLFTVMAIVMASISLSAQEISPGGESVSVTYNNQKKSFLRPPCKIKPDYRCTVTITFGE